MDDKEKGWVVLRIKQAERRLADLETDLHKTRKRITGGVGIFIFVVLALLVYHNGWVKPLIKSHDDLVEVFNHNVRRHNERLLR